jgi:hypothetical protein
MMGEVLGPRLILADPDPGSRMFEFVRIRYHDPALDALRAINVQTDSVDKIIRVILDKTSQIKPHVLLNFANADSVKIAIVYAFWLIDSSVSDDTRSILEQKKNAVFTQAGVDSDERAQREFKWVMEHDVNTRPTKAPGPVSSKMKLLETISRISDLL